MITRSHRNQPIQVCLNSPANHQGRKKFASLLQPTLFQQNNLSTICFRKVVWTQQLSEYIFAKCAKWHQASIKKSSLYHQSSNTIIPNNSSYIHHKTKYVNGNSTVKSSALKRNQVCKKGTLLQSLEH